MKYYVVSDVHAFYDEMLEALEKAGFDKNNPDHVFVSCGDLLDRGEKPYQCLRFVNSLERKILIRGNHEDLLEECLNRHRIESHDVHNGTDRTIVDLATCSVEHEGLEKGNHDRFTACRANKELTKYLDSLVDYAEIGKYIFVHGFIPVKPVYSCDKLFPYITDFKKNKNWRTCDWSYARWYNAAKMKKYYDLTLKSKCIVSGHWHCNYAHFILEEGHDPAFMVDEWAEPNFEPYISKDLICLDACTAVSHKVNCVVLKVK